MAGGWEQWGQGIVISEEGVCQVQFTHRETFQASNPRAHLACQGISRDVTHTLNPPTSSTKESGHTAPDAHFVGKKAEASREVSHPHQHQQLNRNSSFTLDLGRKAREIVSFKRPLSASRISRAGGFPMWGHICGAACKTALTGDAHGRLPGTLSHTSPSPVQAPCGLSLLTTGKSCLTLGRWTPSSPTGPRGL